MTTITVPTASYRQFDADVTAEVPGEAYGGWHTVSLPLNLGRTALVVMHAWDAGTASEYPGWFRAVEYIPRAYRISASVFPPLLSAARTAGLRVLHVVGGPDYYSHLPGFAGGTPDVPPAADLTAEPDPDYQRLCDYRSASVFPGAHNQSDCDTGFSAITFLPAAVPAAGEGIAATSADLLKLCRDSGINHLIYTGFAINACLLMSPGGMLDMSRQGYLCSTVREAVTAVENKETARDEAAKELALWTVALHFGFVYGLDDLITALGGGGVRSD